MLGVLAVGSGTANAAVIRQSNNFPPFLCADVRSGAITDGTPVLAYPCHAGFPQQWEYLAGQFLGLGTANGVGKCLDIRGAGPNPPGTVVQLFTCNGGGNQQWEILNGGIYNPQSGLCLDDSGGVGAQLTIQQCNRSQSQNWAVD
jgi:hypothetical protein